MSLSKRKRFDVFKRDGFKCIYCGQTPPIVVLEVDHVNPKSNGGSDDIDNLVTACFDCNRGKAAKELSDIPKTLIEKTATLKEKENQIVEYNKILNRIEKRLMNECKIIDDKFVLYYKKSLDESFLTGSVKRFIAHLGVYPVLDAMDSACSKIPNNSYQALKYFCGICWGEIKRSYDGK